MLCPVRAVFTSVNRERRSNPAKGYWVLKIHGRYERVVGDDPGQDADDEHSSDHGEQQR